MAVATRRRVKRGNTPAASTKGESWAIVNATTGKVVRELEWGKSATLALAQTLVHAAPEGSTYHVEHRYLFGTATKLYRVDHVEGNVVFTTTLAEGG